MIIRERPYQREFVYGNASWPGVIPAWDGGDSAVLGVLPTGCGKTICAGILAHHAAEQGKGRSLFVAGREILVNQAASKIRCFGVSVGVEMADRRHTDESLFSGGKRPDVVVGSVQSLQGKRLKSFDPGEFNQLMVDECHHARASSYLRIIDHFKDIRHLGITATPERGDGRNLGSIYSRVAFDYSMRQAIVDGWLAPLTCVRLPCDVDLRSIDTRRNRGDYSQEQLARLIGPHVEPLCRVVADEIGDRPTVVFVPDVIAAKVAADAFTKLGKPARAMWGEMSEADRDEAQRQYDEGSVQVLTNCDYLTEGWDAPKTSCIVVMRPTKLRSRYAQMIGRGTRISPETGKTDCLVLDFAWETTAGHSLVSPIELFDDSNTPEEVALIAAALMDKGRTKDPAKAIKNAQMLFAIREQRRLTIELQNRKTSYRKITFDPLDVGALVGLPLRRDWDFSDENPASEKQLDFLKKLGMEKPEGLSRIGAGKAIGYLKDRRARDLATPRQVNFLIRLGVDLERARAMSFPDARATIDSLKGAKTG